MTRTIKIGLLGNPNSGKTTLFNALTGARQRVGNWPGVTVEKRSGWFRQDDLQVEVIDLPGTYSLSAIDTSIDESIARKYAATGEADLIVNIVDAANLERNLYLTTQLLDMGVPVVVALNMWDVAKARGLKIDAAKLSSALGCPVIATVSNHGDGVDSLREAIIRLGGAEAPQGASPVRFTPAVEQVLGELAGMLKDSAAAEAGNRRGDAGLRWDAIQLLEGDPERRARLAPDQVGRLDALQTALEEEQEEDADILLADARYGFIGAATKAAVKRPGRISHTLSDRIDRVVLNRWLGIPIFLGAMYLMFVWTIHVGGAFIDFFDILFGTLFVDGVGAAASALGSPEWLTVLLADGVGGGLQTVATFIPIIAFLYLFLSALEDSGYMARAAFVMDRFMRSAGLPGKAFVPLIVGFGCNVPAIMATRTLESDADRKTAIMMSPFMSCGARLPVYALFAAAFFPTSGQNLVFALYLLGVLVAVLTGYVLRKTLLPGEVSPLVMELPPYHVPGGRNVAIRTWDRLRTFIFRAGKVIVPMVMILSILNALGTDGSFGHENRESSVLAEVSRTVTPAFEPMGLEEENWPAVVGVFTGLFAKEAVVGTLDALYTQLGTEGAAAEAGVDIWGGVTEAFATIPENLAGLAGAMADPLGIGVGEIGTIGAAATEQGVEAATFGAMQERFDGQIGAFAYLLFILLYFPCAAAIAAVYRELDMGWTIFAAAWTTGMAYGTATIAYQIGVFARDPASSAAWIAAMVGMFALAVVVMRQLGRSGRIAVQPAE
jgi:ferrous iron transport protein B